MAAVPRRSSRLPSTRLVGRTFGRGSRLFIAPHCSSSAVTGKETSSESTGVLSFLMNEIGIKEKVLAQMVLDKATDPNSLAVFKYKDSTSRNSYKTNTSKAFQAVELTIEGNLKPLVKFLTAQGIRKEELGSIVLAYPPILGYDVQTRIMPILDFLAEIGSEKPIETVVKRPSLLGLDASTSLPQIVDYLRANEYTPEQILDYIENTI